MPEAAVRSNVNQSLDVHRHFFAQVAFHFMLPLDNLPQLHDFILAEIFDTGRTVHPRLLQNLTHQRTADPINICEPYVDLLVPRKVNPGNSCHIEISKPTNVSIQCLHDTRIPLSLPLLMPRIRTQHAEDATTANHFTLRADRLH